MLDSDTKRRIDNCRDILVGKVPDPKSQVEQITIALIYKFMDDIDKESEELGGKPTFFKGEYAQYAWPKIMDTKLGGQARLNIYAEALDKMNFNKNIPQLFRDIFKNAYLPYRDPETLSLFLKEIGSFTYDHSERLGDAFEYLLSIMSSQGEAGQFRTPRHIIEFIVDVIDPKKNETILDPACGTAGFLISSYKHILEKNTKNKPGDKLTPDERAKLAKNIVGYDISPDMVRLSLVNMYLHGFQDPKIYEYDTLGNEERWGDTFDVILANPPFMTPKGGIRPHKRFSIQANRSEVLFADYFMEHLNANGRAGFIVPEGIIFQSANAYKQLRKNLVDNSYLWAVVSLPAGVFNPYSGVKTSILFLDKTIAKNSKEIFFIKIESDGFGLGAQRREIEDNDLPAAIDILKSIVVNGKLTEKNKMTAHAIPKSRIAELGDYNLSGDRYYDDGKSKGKQKWQMVNLGDVCEFIRGVTFSKHDQLETETKDTIRIATTKAAQSEGIVEEDLYFIPRTKVTDENKLLREGDILISTANSLNLLGRTTYITNLKYECSFGAFMSLIRTDALKCIPLYLFQILRSKRAKDYFLSVANTTTNISNLSFNDLEKLLIPLPPIEVQREIVSEIEGYQKIIDGARQVVENWKPRIEIDPSWPMVKLADVFSEIKNGKNVEQNDEVGKYRVSRIQTISDWSIDLSKTKWTNDDVDEKDFLQEGDILLSHINSIDHLAKTALFTGISEKVVHGINLLRLRPIASQIIPEYAWVIMKSDEFINKARSFAQKAVNQASIKTSDLKSIEIPLPTIEIQQRIVTSIDNENRIIEGCKQIIVINEAKIKRVIDAVWGE